MCILHLVGIAAAFARRGPTVLPAASSALYLSRSFRIIGNEMGKVRLLTFLLVMSSLSRHGSVISGRLFFDEPKSLLYHYGRGSFQRTLTSKPALWRYCSHEGALLSFWCYIPTSNLGAFSSSEHVDLFLLTSLSLETYWSFPASVLWCGHVAKCIGNNENVSTGDMAADS